MAPASAGVTWLDFRDSTPTQSTSSRTDSQARRSPSPELSKLESPNCRLVFFLFIRLPLRPEPGPRVGSHGQCSPIRGFGYDQCRAGKNADRTNGKLGSHSDSFPSNWNGSFQWGLPVTAVPSSGRLQPPLQQRSSIYFARLSKSRTGNFLGYINNQLSVTYLTMIGKLFVAGATVEAATPKAADLEGRRLRYARSYRHAGSG
jgi:hypothetical protein